MKLHWAEAAARVLKRNPYNVIASGTSISGEPHLGNLSDVVRANAVARCLREESIECEEIWISDNIDPLRRLPPGLESLREHLGKPYSDVPDPEGCHRNFAEHFEEPFVEQCHSLGCWPRVVRARELYKSGALAELTRRAMESRERIVAILNRWRQRPLPSDWWPFAAICKGCGRIATTRIISYDGERAQYACGERVLSKEAPIAGCGYVGDIDWREGKLLWRVEWPARWLYFKVTCEPFGKEHAASGGSWDTGCAIAREIFSHEPPLPIIYEHFTVRGRKMSKSAGNIITLSDWLEVATVETARWLMLRDPTSARDLDLKEQVPHFFEDYQRGEEAYWEAALFARRYGGDAQTKLSKLYTLSQVDVSKMPLQRPVALPYTFAAAIAQLAKTREGRIALLKRTGHWREDEGGALLRLIECAERWLQRYRNERYFIEFAPPGLRREAFEKLSSDSKQAFARFLKAYEKGDVRQAIRATCVECGVSIQKLFEIIYLSLFARTRGPRLETLEALVGKSALLEAMSCVLSAEGLQ